MILAAGYATRLYPLTLNKAKPLLTVGSKPIIEWLVDNLAGIPALETIYIVTNDKFSADFQAWSQAYQKRHPEFRFKVVNDGSTSDGDKLGAIGDIDFVVTHENLSETGLLIAAGDNLFTNSLADFVAYARNTEVTVAVHDVGDTEAIKKYGNVAVDAAGVITQFEEKPQKPQGTLAAIALYYYSPAVLSLLRTYLAGGNNADQPGRFVQWLYSRKPVKTFQIKDQWLDIGSKETLENADKILASYVGR
ncbi:MAG: nucleoside-diphosphate-sugar pyrophosphorylase [Verrucomicrobia bacterium]|nr:MAG: nucleoside-diphosphate-sugar pyrophosphorylase [Verrucomicrobiota bacterium]PYL77830.1 MAG: nucleoside-diphosphate-sugar pyrophosphorylase [Verrucomicrobiota bacterium]